MFTKPRSAVIPFYENRAHKTAGISRRRLLLWGTAGAVVVIIQYNTNTNVLIKVTVSRKRCRGTVQKLRISQRCQPWAVFAIRCPADGTTSWRGSFSALGRRALEISQLWQILILILVWHWCPMAQCDAWSVVIGQLDAWLYREDKILGEIFLHSLNCNHVSGRIKVSCWAAV